jgi:glycosyltransferase involved in cell wall biosynthesis
MRIAQVAPLAESVPPKLYGGTERIVSYLTEELVRAGHEVTLFASGDSRTAANLHAVIPTASRLLEGVKDPSVFTAMQLEMLRRCADDFDIIHFHTDHYHQPLVRSLGLQNVLTTMHGRLDLPGYPEMFAEFGEAPLVSISDNQRKALPAANWVGTVHHGLPQDVCGFVPGPRDEYLAFLGRFSPEKRADRAIEIARRAGMRIRLAAKVDEADRRYFREQIEPLLGQPHVEYVGEVCESEKCAFLGNARALLFPIDWPEPFGLVMIEAMSCGTPCIAWRAGSVPEVIQEGVNGFIVDSIDDALQAVRKAATLDRRGVRQSFERRFSAERMTRDYLEIYRRLARRRPGKAAA